MRIGIMRKSTVFLYFPKMFIPTSLLSVPCQESSSSFDFDPSLFLSNNKMKNIEGEALKCKEDDGL